MVNYYTKKEIKTIEKYYRGEISQREMSHEFSRLKANYLKNIESKITAEKEQPVKKYHH